MPKGLLKVLVVLAAALAAGVPAAGESGSRGDSPGGAWLGVALVAEEVTGAEDGVLVAHVVPDGPAERAGVGPGDWITGIDGRPVRRYEDLAAALALLSPGQRVALDVRRGEQILAPRVTLEGPRRVYLFGRAGEIRDSLHEEMSRIDEERLRRSVEALRHAVAARGRWRAAVGEDAPPRSRPTAGAFRSPVRGLDLVEIPADLRVHLGAPAESGLLVARVEAPSGVEQAGLRVGDVVIRFGSRTLSRRSDLAVAVAEGLGEAALPVTLVRSGRSLTISLPPESLSGQEPSLALGDVGGKAAILLQERIRELEAKIQALERALGDSSDEP